MMFVLQRGMIAFVLMFHLCTALSEEVDAQSTAASVAAQAAPIPFKKEEGSPGSDLARLAGGMVVCGLLLAGVLFVLRRHVHQRGSKGTQRRLIEVLETQRVGPRATLHAVRFANSVYLIAYSERGVETVARTESEATMVEEGKA